MKRLIFLFVMFVGMVFYTNAQTTIRVSSVNLSQKDKQTSILFQSLKGKDRLEVGQQLQNLLRVKGGGSDVVTASNRFGAKTTTVNDLVALLGEPDAKIQENMLFYNLKPGTSARLVVGLDKEKQVQFCTIKFL